MPKPNQKKQIAILGGILGAIALMLLYYFHALFLPAPTGEVVILPPQQRLNLPRMTTANNVLYTRPDFHALVDVKNVPVRPVELNGFGSPFDDISPR